MYPMKILFFSHEKYVAGRYTPCDRRWFAPRDIWMRVVCDISGWVRWGKDAYLHFTSVELTKRKTVPVEDWYGNTANWQWCYYSLKSYYSLKVYCSPCPLPAMPLLSSMSLSSGQILLFLPTVAFLQGLKTLQLYGCWRENLRKKLRCRSQKWHNLCF